MHHCVRLGLHCIPATHSRQHYQCTHTQQNPTCGDYQTIWLLTLYDTMDHIDFLFVCTTRVILGEFYSIMEHTVHTTHVQSYRQTIINHI